MVTNPSMDDELRKNSLSVDARLGSLVGNDSGYATFEPDDNGQNTPVASPSSPPVMLGATAQLSADRARVETSDAPTTIERVVPSVGNLIERIENYIVKNTYNTNLINIFKIETNTKNKNIKKTQKENIKKIQKEKTVQKENTKKAQKENNDKKTKNKIMAVSFNKKYVHFNLLMLIFKKFLRSHEM